MFSKILSYSFVLTLFFSCQTLKYEPVKTPKERDRERKTTIENYLKTEFEKNKVNYIPIAYGRSTVVKPSSYYELDSLYGIKYKLEKQNKTDKNLERKINEQRLKISNDTTPVYFIEEHIFSTKDQEEYKAFYSEITVSKANVVQTMDIKRSAIIPKNLIYFFADFCLNRSFVYEGANLDESEIAFYEYYSDKLNRFDNDAEADVFMTTMLKIMKAASDSKNLDKSNLIQLMTLEYLFGNSMIPSDLNFVSIDELVNQNNQLEYYQLVLVYQAKNENNKYVKKAINIKLDPYLSLIEMKELKPTN